MVWLTRALFGHQYRHPNIPGRLFTGKKRRATQMTRGMMKNMEKRLGIEEENARHLSVPYLTKAEEYGQREFEEQKAKDLATKEWEKYRLKNMKGHRTIAEHVGYLKNFSKWE